LHRQFFVAIKTRHWQLCLLCRLAAGGSTEEAVLALQEELHEKEMRLTDVQLEALSSAHQMQQLQDTISRMKVIPLLRFRVRLTCKQSLRPIVGPPQYVPAAPCKW